MTISTEVLSSDSAREPWKVDLPAYTFTPGSSHQLKATASYGSGTVREHVSWATISWEKWPTWAIGRLFHAQVFGLEVSTALPPIIRISGPYMVSETCSFTLDARSEDLEISRAFISFQLSDPFLFVFFGFPFWLSFFLALSG